MAYPNRWCELVQEFGRSYGELSAIFTHMISDINYRSTHLLQDVDNLPWFRGELQGFCDAIHDKRVPLRNCWGFIDGTARPIPRPAVNQRVAFCGHKRCHAIKFQAIMAPKGLICHLYGPIEGKRHDSVMLHESNLFAQLERLGNANNGDPFCIYGGPAYPLRPQLICPYRGDKIFSIGTWAHVDRQLNGGFGT